MATYNIDAAHSEITFKVKHLMITNVTGRFKTFSGKMESSSDDFSDAKIEFEANIDSIHLRTGDFLDAATYPKLTFVSTSFDKVADGIYKLNGDLSIHGVTKPVTMSTELTGTNTDPWGQSKVGFEITGSIHRKDYGMEYNAALETGGVLVGDEVKLQLDVQLVKQA